jgi:hypothetical protein
VNASDVITITGCTLRDFAKANNAVSVSIEDQDGTLWTWREGQGLRVKTERRTLKVPDETLDLTGEQRWVVAADA